MYRNKCYSFKRHGSWKPKIGFAVIKVKTIIKIINNNKFNIYPLNRRYSFEN